MIEEVTHAVLVADGDTGADAGRRVWVLLVHDVPAGCCGSDGHAFDYSLAFERARTRSVKCMTSSRSFVWIITGATRGFGRAIAERALERGDAVVAAVRRPAALRDLSEQYPASLEAVEYDARHIDRVSQVVEAATQRFGRIDALVNNAGRGYVGAAEEITDIELRESLALHLFAPAALVRAVLPRMRAQGTGTVVQMSSQGGRFAFPGVGAYCAGKFALEGWSEALAGEVAPFGVRVMLVEPSRFRTGFNGKGTLATAEPSDTYRDALAPVRADLANADGVQEGDPTKAAEIIIELVHGAELPLRLPLGAEAVRRLRTSYRTNLELLEQWADTAGSADFADAAPGRPADLTASKG